VSIPNRRPGAGNSTAMAHNHVGIRVPRAQTTIARPVSISGIGYWSGLDVNIQFRPATVDSGIVFVRCDGPSPVKIPARVGNRVDIMRRTSIARDEFSVDMIEHLMAALSGMQIDNCEVWVDRAEMPGLDGSSYRFCDMLAGAGRVNQQALRPILRVTTPIRIQDRETWIEARPHGSFAIEYQLEYNHRAIGNQVYCAEITPTVFMEQLASARTFMLQSEAEMIQAQGLGKHVSYSDLLVIGEDGPIKNQLRFPNEYARHKALDLIGDLALAPFDIQAKITAHRSGHRLNAEMAKELLAQAEIVRSGRMSA
jgi:UDP-3-O-[3-hydroxymyristoyl] N-acetylglucosamine deacetylase